MKHRTNRERVLWSKWGASLQEKRRAAGLSQTDLAKLVKATQGQVSEWETGTRPPTDLLKMRLADALGCTLADLFPWPAALPPERRVAA